MGLIHKTISRTLVALAATTVLSGCAVVADLNPLTSQDVAAAPDVMPGELEPIHAAAVTNDLAVFWVSSNGCTAKDDLRPVVSGHGDASVITLRRISEDKCETPLDDGVEVIWSFEELGLQPGTSVSINNPYMLPHT